MVLGALVRFGRLSGWLGLGAALAGGGLVVVAPEQTGWITALEGAAFVLLVVFFVVYFEAFKSLSRRRATRFGANSLLMVALVLGILGVLNFLVSRQTWRVDLTETGRYTLSPETARVLDSLKRAVKITAFFQEGAPSRAKAKDLFEQYRVRARTITYEIIDPDKQPAVAKKYGVTQYDTVVFESGSQVTTVRNPTEAELTNAVIRVSRDERHTVVFVEGHGEHRLDDADKAGYANAKAMLEKQGYVVRSILLMQEGRLPAETSAVVVAGPAKPFFPQERQVLESYLASGGQLLLLLEPRTETGLEPLLSAWGVVLRQDFVIDRLSRLFGGDYTIPIVTSYAPHEITRDLRLATFFPMARSLAFDQAKAPSADWTPLAMTSPAPNSWAETDAAAWASSGSARYDPKDDQSGPITIGAALTRKAGPEQHDTAARTRLVVFGDADFASNGYIAFSGNSDLFLAVVNWLVQHGDQVVIPPREPRTSLLLLSAGQGRILFVLSLGVVPALVFGAGLIVWWRRRRR